MNKDHFFKSAVMALVATLAVTALVLGGGAPAGTAMAASGSDMAQGGKGADKALSKQFDRLEKALEHQQARIEKAAKIQEKVQSWIEKNEAKGKDTAGLEAGLAEFNAKVVEAQAFTEQAGALLAAHAGFDAEGNVTDAQAARETIKQVRELLRSAHKALTGAVPAMRHAINEYRHPGQGADGQGNGKGNKPEDKGNKPEDKGNKGNQGQGDDDGDATETPEPTETSG